MTDKFWTAKFAEYCERDYEKLNCTSFLKNKMLMNGQPGWFNRRRCASENSIFVIH